MSTTWSGVVDAARRIRRRPATTLGVLATLAVGVGTFAAVAQLRRAVLRPLPYPDPDRLVHVLEQDRGHAERVAAVAPADYLAWKANARALASLGAYVPAAPVEARLDGEPASVARAAVSAGLLETLAPRPLAGRLFDAAEARGQGSPVLVGEGLWRRAFGARQAILGTTLALAGTTHTIVGVLPRSFRLPGGDADVVVPLVFTAEHGRDRSAAYLGVIGRMAPAATADQVAAELSTLLRGVDRALGTPEVAKVASVRSLYGWFTEGLRPAMASLLAAAAVLALVAVANATGVLLAGRLRRARDAAVRRALGADAGVRRGELAVEIATHGLGGAVLGIGVATALAALLPDPRGVYVARSVVIGFDGGATLLSGLVAVVAAAVVSLAARAAVPGGDAGAVPHGRQGTLARGGRRILAALGIAQAAMAAAVFLGALALASAWERQRAADETFAPAAAAAFDLALPAARYPDTAAVLAFHARALAALGELPGVRGVAAIKALAPRAPWSFRPELGGGRAPVFAWQVVSPELFAVLDLPLVAGRRLTARDDATSQRVAVVNAAAVRGFGDEGIRPGGTLRFHGAAVALVGVVEDGSANPTVYLPLAQSPVPADALRDLSYVLRADRGAPPLAGVRAKLRALDPELPVVGLGSLRDRLAGGIRYAQARLDAAAASTFAGLAIACLLASLYGAMALQVGARRREFAVRMALGARPRGIAWLVLSHGAGLAAAGAALGLAVGLGALRALAARVAGLRALPPAGPLVVFTALIAVALAACALPALRASRTDPARILASD